MIYAKDVDGEYVLVVEDDLMLLATTQSVLVDQGYRVASCSTPEEAIAICSQYPQARVVLTEAAFPGSQLSGIHIAEYAARTCGAITVLTGHHDPTLLYGLPAFDKFTFVPQPCTSSQILDAVAEAWSNAHPSREYDPPADLDPPADPDPPADLDPPADPDPPPAGPEPGPAKDCLGC